MKLPRSSKRNRRSEAGQSFLIVLVFILVILLGVMGIAIDYSQVWAHRQMAQGAADASCQAAAADLYRAAVARTTYSWVGTAFDCSTNTSSAPCKYAQFNGYTGSGVAVSFPSSLPGVSSLPSAFAITNPYVEVKITDPVPMSLSKLLGAPANFNVTAKAGCGIIVVSQRIPLLVLNLNNSPTFQTNGGSTVKIEGGPQRSIQVNSSSASGTIIGSNTTIDLHLAGPSSTGGDFAVGGTQASPGTPAPLNVGSTGQWVKSAFPLNDPFANIAAPTQPSTAGTAFVVAFAVNGCPDPSGCVEFTAGDYTACSSTNNQAYLANACPTTPNFASPYGAPWVGGQTYSTGSLIVPPHAVNTNDFMFMATNTAAGTTSTTQPSWSTHAVNTTFTDGSVTWKNMGPVASTPKTAIFDPGVYYLGNSGLQPGSNTTLRTSTAAGDGTGGLLFYFSTAKSASIGSNSGAANKCTSVTANTNSWNVSPNNCIVQYNIDGSSSFGVASRTLMCAANSPPNPTDVLANFSGNILLGPCTGPSAGQTQDYSGGIDTTGTYAGPNRGFLFFQNRATAADGGTCTAGFTGKCAVLGGGGSYIFSGYAYFHKSTGLTGTSCGTDMSCVTYAGGSGSNSVTLGNIVIDQISLTGGGSLEMVLNSYTSFPILKPSLLE